MATDSRRAGIIFVRVDGGQLDAKGAFTYNLGAPKREAIVGSDAVHGFKETPQVAFIEGKVTDRGSLSVAALTAIEDSTVTLELANGKVVVLHGAWFAADGQAETGDGEINVRFEGDFAEEI